MYYIYKHQNKLNNKTYIGCTVNPTKRWRNGRGYEKNPVFSRDINTYGWDSFSHVILLQVEDLNLASLLETELINLYRPEYNRYHRSSKSIRPLNTGNSKPVQQISVETGEVINIFPSAAEATRQVPGTDFANISDCCHGRRKTAGGYRWAFVDKEGSR